MNPQEANYEVERPGARRRLVPRQMTELELYRATDMALRSNRQLLCNSCYVDLSKMRGDKLLSCSLNARPIERGTEFFNNFMRWSSTQVINPKCCMCGDLRETEIRVVVMTSQGRFKVFRHMVAKRRADDSPEGEMDLGAEAANFMRGGREEAKRSRREEQMEE